MKVQKKRGARSSQFFAGDFVFIAVCILGAAAALYCFQKDLNQTLNRLSEQPVGTITYKYRAASRRFADRVIWDRLKQQSPVYNGDFIRTAELSQASVSFFDSLDFSNGGELISLEENTLIQIIAETGGFRIDLAEGEVSAESQGGRLSLYSGGATVDIASGSLVNAEVTGNSVTGNGSLELRVLEGSAEFGSGGTSQRVAAGETVTAAAGLPQNTARVAVTSPRPQAKFLNTGEGSLPVTFSFNRIGFRGNETVRLDISADRNFSRLLSSTESGGGITVNLDNVAYYWRAYPSSSTGEVKQGGVTGRISVVPAEAPRLISPAQNERFAFSSTRPGIRLQWSSCEGAVSYLVEAAGNAAMNNPLYRNQVESTGGNVVSIIHYGFDSGNFYWRVSPVYPRNYEGQGRSSLTGFFTIERTQTLAAPRTQSGQETVYLETQTENQEQTYFSWSHEKDAAWYTFLFSANEDLSKPIIEQQVRDNYYAVNVSDFNSGTYYWGVYQTDNSGNKSAASRSRTLIVKAGAPPAAVAAAGQAGSPQTNTVTADVSGTPDTEETPESGTDAAAAAPPPVPTGLKPGANYVLTEEIIARDRRLSFSWNPSQGAAGYIFTIVQANGSQVLRRTTQEASFTLLDLEVLDRGNFVWQVEAVDSGGQRSPAAEQRFRVDIAEIEAAQGIESEVFGR